MEKAHRLWHKKKQIRPEKFDLRDDGQRQQIREAALQREFPFNKKKNMRKQKKKKRKSNPSQNPEAPRNQQQRGEHHERVFWKAYIRSHGWEWSQDWEEFFGFFQDRYENDDFGTYCNVDTGETLEEERTRRERKVWEKILQNEKGPNIA